MRIRSIQYGGITHLHMQPCLPSRQDVPTPHATRHLPDIDSIDEQITQYAAGPDNAISKEASIGRADYMLAGGSLTVYLALPHDGCTSQG